MTKESDSLKFGEKVREEAGRKGVLVPTLSDEFEAGETENVGVVIDTRTNKPKEVDKLKNSWAKKLVASVAVYAALNGAVPTDIFENGLEKAVAASPAIKIASSGELAPGSEVVASEQKLQAIFNIDSHIYISTNPAAGEMNVLKKSDVAPRIVDGRTLLVVRPVAEATGALVSWDPETETASLVKDGKTVRIKKNSYILEIEDSSGVCYVKMDVPAQIIDGRFVLPVRFIIEALGDTVIWDEETRSVYVGYTQEQVDSFKGAWRQENEPMDALKNPETIYEVFQHMAGGEFADFIAFSNVIINEDTSGAKIVFSNEDSKRVDPLAHAVLDGTTYTLKDLDREYLKQSGVDKIVGELKKGDVVFVKDGEFYVFNKDNLKEGNKSIIKYDKIGNKQIVVNEKVGIAYHSRITWGNDGIYVFDGTRKTYKLDTLSGKFIELEKVEFVGNLKQRSLKNLLGAYDGNGFGNVSNPLGIKYQDIIAFKEERYDEMESVELIKVDEDHGFFVLKGGIAGFQKQKSIDNLKLTVQRVNEVSRGIAIGWVSRGFDFISANDVSSTFFYDDLSKNWGATYHPFGFGGVIFFNENATSFARPPVYFINVIEEESAGLKYETSESESREVSYEKGEKFKKSVLKQTMGKYFPLDYGDKWSGYESLKSIYPDWNWETQGKY
ncbi:MAG: stalk domain-containing protein [Candidatus Shapirobacteria bacterium]|nr:stalk domain-containing protein [Candidatus Shapirobacteria bacterium]